MSNQIINSVKSTRLNLRCTDELINQITEINKINYGAGNTDLLTATAIIHEGVRRYYRYCTSSKQLTIDNSPEPKPKTRRKKVAKETPAIGLS